MCKSKLATLASTPMPPRNSRSRSRSTTTTTNSSSSGAVGSGRAASSSTASASSGRASLAAARASLPDQPVLLPFPELAAATNHFLSKRSSSSSSSFSYWRCSLRGRDAAVFQLRSLAAGDETAAAAALARLGKSHHTSLARLLGASLTGDHIYLAYELPPGAATLAACLHNPRNRSFTVLPTWVSRVQVADDVAQGLEYIHHHASAVHGRLTSSTVLVLDPSLRAKISHFGAADLLAAADIGNPYTAPELAAGEPATRASDVFAFGVLLLELISGEEPAKYRFDRARKEFVRVSVVAAAAAAADSEEGAEEEERSGRVRRWVDRRLRDSFPVAAAERLMAVGLRCAAEAAEERPEMTWVAGKMSRVYLESKAWEEKVRVPTEFSVSVAPR